MANHHDDRFDWDRYEAEVVDLDAKRAERDAASDPADDRPTLVDSPEAQRPAGWSVDGLRRAHRRPIVPAWARSRAAFLDAARWVASHYTHKTAYHLTRSPKYALKLAIRTPRGAFRTFTDLSRWMTDAEGLPVRLASVRREDAEMYLKLSRQRDARVRLRTLIVGAAALLGAGMTFTLIVAAPTWAHWTALTVAVALAGWRGSPADRPLLDTAVTVAQAPKLTSDVVTRALSQIGIPEVRQALARNPRAVGFPDPIARDGGGWRATVDLPPGVTAGMVMGKREELASALGRPLGCVWPEGRPEVSPSRLVLWVGDQDMAAARPAVWPLYRRGTVDLFRPFPFGTDPRGQIVALELFGTNMLIGSIPGVGKTRALLVALLSAALDVRAEIWDFDLKGLGDHRPIGRVATRFVAGQTDDHIEATYQGLVDLRAECQRRQKVMDGLPDRDKPEGMVTPELASRKGLGLHPLVVAVDECQELFSHSEFGKEAGILAEKIIRIGRALNVILLLATQRPDAKSLPSGVTANVGTRFCLRVMDQTANDMVLGTSAYKNGIRANIFAKKDKGVGWLVGAGDEPQITRAYFLDTPAANRVIDRAAAMREKAGTLPAPQDTPTGAPTVRRDTLPEDVLSVVPATEDKTWSETVVARLAELRPDAYTGWTTKHLAAALEPHGIDTVQVWGTDPESGKGANRKGIIRAHIADKVAQRNRRPEAS